MVGTLTLANQHFNRGRASADRSLDPLRVHRELIMLKFYVAFRVKAEIPSLRWHISCPLEHWDEFLPRPRRLHRSVLLLSWKIRTTTTIHSAQYHTFADIHTKSVTTRICHCITNFLTTTDRQSGILSPPNVGQSPLPAATPRPACCRRPSYTTLQGHSPQEGKPAAHQGSRERGSTTPHDGGFDSGNAGCLLTKAGWDNPNSMKRCSREAGRKLRLPYRNPT